MPQKMPTDKTLKDSIMTSQKNKEVQSTEIQKVIDYLRDMLYTGRLRSGDKMPSERKLSEDLGISRSYVRMAVQKLEFYGIIQTQPQKGSVVMDIPSDQLESLLSDMFKVSRYDFSSLVDVRLLLETEAVRLSALNRTEDDLLAMESAMIECERFFGTEQRVAKDYAFHQSLVHGAHNPVISSLLLVITPDVLKYYQKYKVCSVPVEAVKQEHRSLLEHIRNRNPEQAVAQLRNHLDSLCRTAKTYKL